ncbi:MAG: adenylyltransferase/cytidyltransferase family protein [Bacteroidales bacterium]|jgi:glycerol-3-phosphate cytidylyltransferase|nr:adenylyltransferase/cytidyltransferase family protein [Bacteroidales bacterium]
MKIIGFTAGVFDMFHVGHLNLIENAKANCEHLIVGVNSDKLVETYKGKKTIVPFEERIRIVAAVRAVDETICVDSLDKESIWRIKPFNLLFIGDDWKGNPRWEHTEQVMAEYGVKTIYLPFTKGISTTDIKNKILNL